MAFCRAPNCALSKHSTFRTGCPPNRGIEPLTGWPRRPQSVRGSERVDGPGFPKPRAHTASPARAPSISVPGRGCWATAGGTSDWPCCRPESCLVMLSRSGRPVAAVALSLCEGRPVVRHLIVPRADRRAAPWRMPSRPPPTWSWAGSVGCCRDAGCCDPDSSRQFPAQRSRRRGWPQPSIPRRHPLPLHSVALLSAANCRERSITAAGIRCQK